MSTFDEFLTPEERLALMDARIATLAQQGYQAELDSLAAQENGDSTTTAAAETVVEQVGFDLRALNRAREALVLEINA